jgi:hypothetical protein
MSGCSQPMILLRTRAKSSTVGIDAFPRYTGYPRTEDMHQDDMVGKTDSNGPGSRTVRTTEVVVSWAKSTLIP